jgi:two-component system invasion response regulator UvrY
MPTLSSIFLVEDHIIVRNGLKELIEHMGNYQVTGEFDNGKDLTDKIAYERPDLIIMDLAMPAMDGQQTMKWLKDRRVDHPVLILTLDVTDKTIIELYRLGVRGYLPKTCTADILKKAIDDIINTGYYHNELLSNAIKNKGLNPKNDRDEILKLFSGRELEFLNLVCDKEEYTYEQIADKMRLHRRTVDGYRESLFGKLEIKSKTGLVLFAIKHGIIQI